MPNITDRMKRVAKRRAGQRRDRKSGDRTRRKLERKTAAVRHRTVHDPAAVELVEPGVCLALRAPEANAGERAGRDEHQYSYGEDSHRRNEATTPMPAAQRTKSSGRLA